MTGLSAASTSASACNDGGKKKKKKKKSKSDDDAAAASRRTEERNAFRNIHKINVKGTDVPDPIATFEDMKDKLGFNAILLDNLKNKLEFQRPTPIQMQAIPLLISGLV